ncbi:hypothetical protein DMB92_02615 [Campylobacter sp. MIT 99-7217]|uniref:Panacea domain-containing protein n=1 Tax=Campylobacter sp. MIT 99-7217 TaxID=535091 RepID=UPI001157DE83|nr:type II toxin-antitoxin system antitoxin SocA domain-containing protein [Campylobacter sp. MIT 99-7217]TQR33794.1 hypothetical protein DMB92_02615 [Campylobacter sp. MIT 99-7217]
MKTLKAFDVALYFLFLAKKDNAGDIISNLKMQKLLYYAQGHFLALYDKPLFLEKIEAWKFGPVVKSIYDKFKIYHDLAIDFKELESFNSSVYTEEHLDFLPFFYKKYNSFSAWDLVMKTHSEKPYKDYYLEYNTQEIPLESIKSFFKEQIKKEAKAYL